MDTSKAPILKSFKEHIYTVLQISQIVLTTKPPISFRKCSSHNTMTKYVANGLKTPHSHNKYSVLIPSTRT